MPKEERTTLHSHPAEYKSSDNCNSRGATSPLSQLKRRMLLILERSHRPQYKRMCPDIVLEMSRSVAVIDECPNHNKKKGPRTLQ